MIYISRKSLLLVCLKDYLRVYALFAAAELA